MNSRKLHLSWLMPALLLVIMSCHRSQGHHRVFNRCQLSRELLRYNFPRTLISHWVCIIEQGSDRTVMKISNHTEGHMRYGLFQISSKEWCRVKRKGGLCNVNCEALLNDDLSDDVRCAKRVYDRIGFGGWPEWNAKCRKELPDLSKC